MNGDGSLNVQDIVLVVNYILNGTYNTNGDINQDDVLNVLDVVTIANTILNGLL